MKKLAVALVFGVLAASVSACSAKTPEAADNTAAPEAVETAQPVLVAEAAAPSAVAKAALQTSAPTAVTQAASANWTVDMKESRLGFGGTQTGKAFSGSFERFNAEIVFDPGDLSKSSIDVSIDMSSARSGDRQRDEALRGGEWFNIKAHPTARFHATEVTTTGAGAYIAHGRLTIRDATKPLDLPFTLEIVGDRAKAHGEATLLRTDFGVGQGEFETDEWVGFDVGVTVDITARR